MARRTTIGWEPVHYENRAPKYGKRADVYHARKLFPNYSQFGNPSFSDTIGRQYRMADGYDRLSAEEHGLVEKGPPDKVEPSIYYSEEEGKTIMVFSHEGKAEPRSRGLGISRGSQMLYVRLPRGSKLNLPHVGEKLKMIHEPTGALVSGKVTYIDGLQFPRVSTASVILDDLVFINPRE